MVSVDRSKRRNDNQLKRRRKSHTLLMTAKIKGVKPHVSNRQFLGSYTSTLVSLLIVHMFLGPTNPIPSGYPSSNVRSIFIEQPSPTTSTRALAHRGESSCGLVAKTPQKDSTAHHQSSQLQHSYLSLSQHGAISQQYPTNVIPESERGRKRKKKRTNLDAT